MHFSLGHEPILQEEINLITNIAARDSTKLFDNLCYRPQEYTITSVQ